MYSGKTKVIESLDDTIEELLSDSSKVEHISIISSSSFIFFFESIISLTHKRIGK